VTRPDTSAFYIGQPATRSGKNTGHQHHPNHPKHRINSLCLVRIDDCGYYLRLLCGIAEYYCGETCPRAGCLRVLVVASAVLPPILFLHLRLLVVDQTHCLPRDGTNGDPKPQENFLWRLPRLQQSRLDPHRSEEQKLSPAFIPLRCLGLLPRRRKRKRKQRTPQLLLQQPRAKSLLPATPMTKSHPQRM